MSTTSTSPRRGVDLLDDPRPMTDTTRSQVLNIGLMAIAAHAAHHGLPAPLAIDLEVDPLRDVAISIRVVGFGNAQRWLNTVHVDEATEDHQSKHSRFSWSVRLPETGTQVEIRTLVPGAGVALKAVTV